ncbi:similar to Saccharomyces cerevisiae YMR156C TPP1 DNA 3'-phosphatase that functions in repair of endogenous damage of double-stranded DNA [Maudiozyma saulgeensis]|uniref:Similar to Saccharomyces cerevisiae YMR156C TPP1 DNA 3'-phosphatase that functions in repair of endogenous damage of double-stranded DNA n=1 Tax=Maudiozyma saulgeensis TaxID=1789683 RepID=A0A1X7R0N7_9SACH|nr:similar to Saccharomyces cerevisiae YMR156C TPP1 DNA 3'-phosphatase that functions in repair of endogenous damage of double-stranded DNA [Kazachstania saulgeensis]
MSHNRYITPELIKYTPKNGEVPADDAKFYAFDLDHTLIQPKNPKAIFARGPNDWKFMEFKDGEQTLTTLINICKNDSKVQIVIFTNQGGVITVPSNSKSCNTFTSKIENVFKYISTQENGDLLLSRLWLYSSTMKPAALFPKQKKQTSKKSITKQSTLPFLERPKDNKKEVGDSNKSLEELFNSMRKPNIGMGERFIKDIQKRNPSIMKHNMKWAYYCGDAAGRSSDFSDTDKIFAKNMGIDFKTPEEVFIS